MEPRRQLSGSKSLIYLKISVRVCAGEQIMTMFEPGITSLALLDTLLMRPVMLPRCSQVDFAVLATIDSLKSSGRRVRMLIFQLGCRWPITAIDAMARLPPPANVS